MAPVDFKSKRPLKVGTFLIMSAAKIGAAFAEEPPSETPHDCRALELGERMEEPERTLDGSLSEDKLARCQGVLKPPSVGDQELVEPAPPEGTTPVIQPDEIPETDEY